MSDKTFRSELIELLDKHQIGETTNTPSHILAELIEQNIAGYNLATIQRDLAVSQYTVLLESQNKDLANQLRKCLDK